MFDLVSLFPLPACLYCSTLPSLNLTVNPKQLVAVVGPVGAGKSSLIQAFLGEMEKLEGHVQLKVLVVCIHNALPPTPVGSNGYFQHVHTYLLDCATFYNIMYILN